jgi:AraC-like DNA-binding protein
MKLYFEKITHSRGQSFTCSEFTGKVFNCPYHFHPEVEITYIASSVGRRFVGDNIGRFGPGDLVMIGGGLPHMYFNDETESPCDPEGARSLVIQFDMELLGDRFWGISEMSEVKALWDRSVRGLRFTGPVVVATVEVMERLKKAEGASRLELLLKLLDGLAASEEWNSLSSIHYSKPNSIAGDQRINKAYAFINERFCDSISQNDVARAVGMSGSAFSRFFRRASGKTFTEFLTEIRIGHACQGLQFSDTRILEVCYACGFSNLSNFNRRFREQVGMTPRQYRAAYSQKINGSGSQSGQSVFIG